MLSTEASVKLNYCPPKEACDEIRPDGIISQPGGSVYSHPKEAVCPLYLIKKIEYQPALRRYNQTYTGTTLLKYSTSVFLSPHSPPIFVLSSPSL